MLAIFACRMSTVLLATGIVALLASSTVATEWSSLFSPRQLQSSGKSTSSKGYYTPPNDEYATQEGKVVKLSGTSSTLFTEDASSTDDSTDDSTVAASGRKGGKGGGMSMTMGKGDRDNKNKGGGGGGMNRNMMRKRMSRRHPPTNPPRRRRTPAPQPAPTRPRPSRPVAPVPRPSATAPRPSTPLPRPSAPSPSTTARSCEPTTGPCVTTADELQVILDEADPDAVVAVCGDENDADNPIILSTSLAIVVEQSGIKLCCAGLIGTCVFESEGTDNNLDVLADSVTLQDLVFLNGVADSSFGGNVVIEGDGAHLIVGCEFRNGEASALGGNLYVATNGILTLEDSTFAEGVAGEAGGGVYVLNAEAVNVIGVDFVGNSAAGGSGGAFYSSRDDPDAQGQDILFEDSIFEGNDATIGGGFFVSQLGTLPSLRILSCDFENNSATDAAGAGGIAESLDNLELEIMSSSSSDNSAPVCPNILGFSEDSTEPVCIELSDDFP